MYEDNLEYAKGRLESTLVRVGEEPFYVHQIKTLGPSMIAEGLFYHSGEVKTVKLSSINIEPVPLGYVNYGAHCYFIMRKPARKWKQGLCFGNIAFVGAQGFREFPINEMRNTIKNIYPTFNEATRLVKGEHKSVAFSRDFAVTRNNEVLYRGRQVGVWDKLINLNDKYKYLSEYVEECANAGT